MTTDAPPPSRLAWSVLPVWVLVALGAVLTGLLAAPHDYLSWMPIVLAGGVLVTFCVQLAIVRKEGLVTRVMASLGGALVILAIATIVLSSSALASA